MTSSLTLPPFRPAPSCSLSLYLGVLCVHCCSHTRYARLEVSLALVSGAPCAFTTHWIGIQLNSLERVIFQFTPHFHSVNHYIVMIYIPWQKPSRERNSNSLLFFFCMISLIDVGKTRRTERGDIVRLQYANSTWNESRRQTKQRLISKTG